MNFDNITIGIKNFKNPSLTNDVVIYGLGDFGKLCASILKKHGYNILYFIDKYKYKTIHEWEEIPVISLEDERLNQIISNGQSCILGIFNAYVDLAHIESDIKNRGFQHVINPLEFHHAFIHDIGNYFWLGDDRAYIEHIQDIRSVYALLSDEHSKKLFENLLDYRIKKELNLVQHPQNVNVQYFPEDIPIAFPTMEFIDCGAYNGDTLMQIVRKNIPLRSFIAFEPDIENINNLSNNLREHVSAAGVVMPCGVWHRSEQLRFSGGTGSSSHISDIGEDIIQAVAMDDVILNQSVNFIKMDIEGAEIQALMGAEKLIKTYQPILAISAYHKHDDLWTIPLLIQDWQLDYKFFLRVYEYNGFELVYYAIPVKYLH